MGHYFGWVGVVEALFWVDGGVLSIILGKWGCVSITLDEWG